MPTQRWSATSATSAASACASARGQMAFVDATRVGLSLAAWFRSLLFVLFRSLLSTVLSPSRFFSGVVLPDHVRSRRCPRARRTSSDRHARPIAGQSRSRRPSRRRQPTRSRCEPHARSITCQSSLCAGGDRCASALARSDPPLGRVPNFTFLHPVLSGSRERWVKNGGGTQLIKILK